MKIEDRIRQSLREQAEQTSVELPGPEDAIARARRRTVKLSAAVVLLVVAVTAGGAVALWDLGESRVEIIDQPDEPVDTLPDDPDTSEADDVTDEATRQGSEMSDCRERPPAHEDETLPGGWTSLPQPPFVRARATSVWTDHGLFYFGGDTRYGATTHNDAAIFDLEEQTWRCLPAAPVHASNAAGVWTGTEVIIWGGGGGAAYDPATDTWRSLPDTPVAARTPAAHVWTGRQMIVWSDVDRSRPHEDGAIYDPDADSWTEMSPAPIALNVAEAAWTGTEMIVVGARQDGNNHATTEYAIGLAYNPATDIWRELPASPLSPQASTVTWTGELLVAVDYIENTAVYDPQTDQWQQVADVPFTIGECYPHSALLDGYVFGLFCGRAALFDLEAHTWTQVPMPDLVFGRPVSTGDQVLIAGAAHEGGHNALWIFDPGDLD